MIMINIWYVPDHGQEQNPSCILVFIVLICVVSRTCP